MKLLIVGSKGMLGSALAKILKDNELVLWDLPEVDITKEDIVDRIVAENPEIVINAAGYTDVDGCESNKKEAKAANVEGVEYLAESCEQLNTPLIHFSTDYVFKGDTKDGYKEDDEINPINSYGKTKAEGEKKLRKITEAHFLIRTSALFGPNGKNFVDTMLEKGKSGGSIQVVNDQMLKPTYTFDVAKKIKELIDMQPEYGIYHIVNEGSVSWYDFAKKIFEIADLQADLTPVSSKQYKTPAKRPTNSTLINTKLKPLRHWAEALEEYIKNKSS